MYSTLLLLTLAHTAQAHGTSSAASDGSMGMMMAALHFTPLGDTLWFAGWAPQTGGILFGACIGLFALALFDRWLASWRRTLAARWELLASANPKTRGRPTLQAPPFILAHDFPRGVLYALQALLGFVLMLAVMTFQVAYIIAVVAGFGVGEMLFGRR
ncbi:Ctr copper transporter family-domain-containing protein [Mycena crocata]|nr:Ctr copper transporter family-domain-containing protein [Mycena crocata]